MATQYNIVAAAVTLCAHPVIAAPHIDASPLDEEITIDGLLDERAWLDAEVHGGFRQREPNEGEPAELPTELRVLYDDDALYVAIRAHDPEPDEIVGLLTRRDEESASDWLWVSIGSLCDQRTAFTFALNAASVQRDYLIYDDTEVDASWDAVWSGAASTDNDGWVAELRIPFTQLRIAKAPNGWGLQAGRLVQRTREESYWAPWPKQSAGRVSLFGRLGGIESVEAERDLALVPYVVLGGNFDPNAGTPRGTAGVDARYQLSSHFRLTAAVNPDFGQVEADPSDVNLTASETFFPEKRPFFIEGIDLFRLRLSQGDGDDAVEELFYSRRIGAPPHREPDDKIRGDMPEQTTIYSAAKLVGKTNDGWSVGALNAMTGEEKVSLRNNDKQVLEPLTSYSVLSLRRDLNDGRTQVGLLATGVHRLLDDTGINDLHRQAYGGGVNLSHRFWQDNWVVQAKLLGSAVLGSAEAIEATQRAPQRYYQRPDASHLSFDPARTELFGLSAQYLAGKVGGGPWRAAIGGETRSPGFEVNDLGFQRSADYAVQWLWLQARNDTPGVLLRNWSANLNAWGVIDYGGEHLTTGGNINANARLLSYWNGSAGIARHQDRWDTSHLRGGPALRAVPSWQVWTALESDPRKALQGNIEGGARFFDDGNAFRASISTELALQVRSNIEVAIEPFWQRNVDDRQYVDTVDNHYLVGRIKQTTFGATLRLSYTFSPTLSLQLYAQPFISTGRFSDYREVSTPRARAYESRFSRVDVSRTGNTLSVDHDGDRVSDFDLDRPDFSFRQLRSNLVVRWEYLPGSTLFLVWSHNRTSEDGRAALGAGPNLEALSNAPGEHVLLLKLSYRIEA